LKLGEDGRVIAPPSLAADVRDAATAALANYVVLSPSLALRLRKLSPAEAAV